MCGVGSGIINFPPFLEYKDFVRFIGSKIKIELDLKIKGEKNYLGIICKCDDGNIELIEFELSDDEEIILFEK